MLCRLPYTEAVIQEAMRMSTLTPIGLHHLANKDIQLAGYNLPKVKYFGFDFSEYGFGEDYLCKWNKWMKLVSKRISKYKWASALSGSDIWRQARNY